MDFPEKNKWVMRLTHAKHNFKDIDLLSRKLPHHPVLRERINQFNASKINSDTIMALLDAGVKPEEIEANRKSEGQSPDDSKLPDTQTGDKAGADTDTKSDKQKAKGKKEEFPNIEWEKLDNIDVQHAILLYNDRVTSYHKAQELEPLLDANPDIAAPYQEAMIRNTLADNELKAYQETGKWLHKHPLGERRKTIDALKKLDAVQFAKAYASSKQNVSRYQSQLNNAKYKDDADRARIEALVKAHQAKLDLMEEIQKK